MEKTIYPGKLLGILIALLIFSCRAHSQSEWEKIKAIRTEADWKLIRDAHLEVMDKLVASPINIAKINLGDEATLLKLVGLSKSKYQEKAGMVKAAATRLAAKYGLSGDCGVCKDQYAMEKFRSLAQNYQANPSKYSSYRTELLGLGLDDEPTRCCGLRFYLCCTVCAATIAAFPAYLACCALCFDTYCCKP